MALRKANGRFTTPDDPCIIRRRAIHDRPDFGVTFAKTFPPYVFSTRSGAALVHRIVNIEMHWYDLLDHEHLVRLNHPRIHAKTVCGQVLFLKLPWRRCHAQTCRALSPDVTLCGRCQGKGPIFSKGSRWV